MIDLSWNSSRLEGDTYSLLETELLLTRGEVEEGKNAMEMQMILNRKAAIILGCALIGTKQYEQAVTILTDMRRQIPGNTEILGNLALASMD